MWDLRGLDLKKLDIKGWDEPGEGMPPRWKDPAPEAKGATPRSDALTGSSSSQQQQPTLQGLQGLARDDFAKILEDAISRCVSKLGQMQAERLDDMFREQQTLLDTSLRRFQNQLKENAAKNAAQAASSATPVPVTTATELTVTPAVANLEAKVSRLLSIVEEGQSDLDHYLMRTKQVVTDAIGEKLDAEWKELLGRLQTEVRSGLVHVPTEESAEEKTRKMMQMLEHDLEENNVPEIEATPRNEEEDEEAPHHGKFPFRLPRSMTWSKAPQNPKDAQKAEDIHKKHKVKRNKASIHLEYMELASGVVTVAHVLFMVVETDRSFDTPIPWSTQVGIECTFLGIYSTELVVRIGMQGKDFFASSLNMLDVVLVISGLMDVVSLILASDGIAIAGPLKALRVLRLQKVFRLRRLVNLIPGTQLLLDSLNTCTAALMGSAVVVFVYTLVTAILVAVLVSGFLQNNADTLTDDEVRFYRDNFGSVLHCSLTLYQSVTSGQDWANVYNALEKVASGTLAMMFIAYHFGFQFLLVNILNSVCVQKVISSTTEHTQAAHYNTYVRDRMDALELVGRCEHKFGTGDLMNYKELLTLMADGEVVKHFDERNVGFGETKMLHSMLAKPVPGENAADEWTHAVNRGDFFEACMRLKHDHMVLDMVMANTAHRLSAEALQEKSDHVQSAVEQVQRKLDVLSHHLAGGGSSQRF